MDKKSILLYLQTILKMRYLFLYILLVINVFSAKSQIHELGLFAGGANYIGDIGPTDYIKPNEPAIGFVYKWNRSTRHAWRFSYTFGKLSSRDIDSDVPSRNLRGFSFENTIHDFSAGLEFNFFEYKLNESGTQFTPYVYNGVSYFIYKELYIINKESEIDYRHSNFAIPMVVGLKSRIVNNLILGAEIGVRWTLTDNLDGSNPKNDDFESLRFGNLNSNDWYVFTGLTLTYTFGQNPCFCAE